MNRYRLQKWMHYRSASIKSQGSKLKFYGNFHNEHMTTPLCKNLQVAPYWASPELKYDWIGWINIVD